MTPKEKAEDMFVEFLQMIPDYVIEENNVSAELAKQHALITVNEILDILENNLDFKMLKSIEFWKEIKSEIEKL